MKRGSVFQELTERIIAARKDLRRKADLEKSLASARRSLRKERDRLWELQEQLVEERADVESLEELSLRRLFHTILGTRQEQTQKEREEVLAAKLKYDECHEAIAALEKQVANLEDQLKLLSGVEARYQELIRRKEQILRQSDDETAKRLMELSEAQADAQSDLRELEEAISAGNAVLSSLDSAVSALRGAETWGTVDLLGGGLLTTAAKHGRVDEARRWTHQAQDRLRRFRWELADLDSDVFLEIDLGGFETFADYFFDGLIVDWVVQSSIRSSLDRTVQMRSRVATAVEELRRERKKSQRRLEKVAKERRTLIERA